MALAISHISFEHHAASALGIAETQPRISWRFEGDAQDWEQSTYEIEISRHTKANQSRSSSSSSSSSSNVFRKESSESLYVPWPDEPLGEAESADVRVRAHGFRDSSSTPWSDWVTVETGLQDGSWEGVLPITGDAGQGSVNETKRPIYFRKEFDIPSGVARARLYITALGLYEAEINGEVVGDRVMAPGWQSYTFRHVYDTYDVTHLLKGGENAIGATVAEGWYSGRLGYGGGYRNIYGDQLGLVSLLVVELEDGGQIRIATDETWKSSRGPLITSEIYDGEVYDASLESLLEGWSASSFDDSSWNATRQLPSLKGQLVSPDQPPVRRTEEIKPKRIFESPSGKTLIDFGQNLVGRLRLHVDGPAGTNITLHHAEVLEKSGELALRPLRKALARDTLLLSGRGPLDWEPRFTFHGFRFAQVDGWPDEAPLDESAITAIVIHTDLEQTGWFECSHQLLNQFHSNVRWSMKGNFLSVPTDCPQRDERMGWTGDAHAFGPTSNFLYNTAGFWRSWHRDVWHEMSIDGLMAPPYFVPSFPDYDSRYRPTAVWGDVVVGNPWNVYRWFGDVAMLEEQLPQAQNWIDVGIPRNDVGLWNRSTFQFGDWLDPRAPPESPGQATTPTHLVADAYLVRMTEILSQMTEVLREDALVEKYKTQHSDLKGRFHEAWMSDDGAFVNRTQTAYALALAFDLLSDDAEVREATSTLRSIIEENDYLVGTGFAGTPALGAALRKANATDDFYSMLLQTRVPSWLYQVVQNATTTWERWDSLLEDGSVNPGEMTSFNHYAFGSVADWIHQTVGGIAPAEPGWKRVAVAPVPGGGIVYAKARHLSPYGVVESSWSVDDEGFHLDVSVPPNARADVVLPGSNETRTVGSGKYTFHDREYRLR